MVLSLNSKCWARIRAAPGATAVGTTVNDREMSASLLVTIERILPGGVGLAHTDGKTVFVSLAAAGDKVRVSVDREQGNLLFASIVEIIEPSPERIRTTLSIFWSLWGL